MHLNTAFIVALVGLTSAVPVIRRSGGSSNYDYCQAPLPTNYEPVKDYSLIKVFLAIRHGDRSPIYTIPHDKQVWSECNEKFDTTLYDNNNNLDNDTNQVALQERIEHPTGNDTYSYAMPKGNCILGQLTDKGKKQHNNLGHSLRNIYVDRLKFLPEDLDADQLYVRSTDVWRTRQSAHSLLNGLYPNGSKADAIEVVTRPSEVENLDRNPYACPVYTKFEKDAKEEPEYKKVWDENKPAMDRINKLMGTENRPEFSERWTVVYDALWTRICHGFPLPCNPKNPNECVTKDDADLALDMAHFEYNWLRRDSAAHYNVNKAYLGSLISDMREEMEVPTIPFTLYSTHDDALATFLGMFDMKGMKFPPYASNLLFEVWQNPMSKPDKIVRVLFNGKPIVPRNGKPCKDLSACPFDTFTEFMGTLIPDNLEEFCQYKH